MSAYPPPPPYSPQFDRRAMQRAAKEQRRAFKQQARMQRDYARRMYRASRRGSIVGPLLLVAIGVVVLLINLHKLTCTRAFAWYGHWWPLVLIGAGVLLLIEWAIDQRGNSDGTPRPPRTLGFGIVSLLIFLAFAGGAARLASHAQDWSNNNFGTPFFGIGRHGWDFALGDQHDWDDALSSPITAGEGLTIRNPHGDVTVAGSSDDGQVHVSVHKRAHATSDSEAADKERQLQPVFSNEGTSLVLSAGSAGGDGRDNLTLQVPRGTPLTISADEGAVNVQGIHATVTLSSNHGEVNVGGIDGAVTVHVNDGDESFSAHSITGPVVLDGHVGDVTVSDITGAVDLHGAFFGTTNLERINGMVSFKTYRTQFTAARVDGNVEVAEGSELQANELLGPVVLHTSDRDITLERVQGSVEIANTDGPVSLTLAAPPGSPLGAVSITNHDGSVTVAVPLVAGFTLAAHTRDGKIANDFGLQAQGSEDSHTLNGVVGSGGPSVTIETQEGDVTVNKSDAAPLGPAPSGPPRITSAPVAPPAPSAAKAPHAPKAPAAPPAPQGPPPAATF